MKPRLTAPAVVMLIAVVTFASAALVAAQTAPPAPYGACPTATQQRWHAMEYYGFCHFTVNTFTDKEWGYGDEDPKVFNPTDFDARQIVQTFKDAGMKMVILTCKHHDGFCLWPSAYTDHCVKNSSWKNGKGDVVREMSEACHALGLKFGIYLSPWDRNRADYATPAYITYYRNQLSELLSNYGEISIVWLDGANGGDGYYGGAREKRTIAADYYDWDNTNKLIHQLQPNAFIHGGAGPETRWIGNEKGYAPDTCWETVDSDLLSHGDWRKLLGPGQRNGPQWRGAECDVSDRPGWYYHSTQDSQVKSPAELLNIYYASVGHGCDLNLNLPPDRRGRIADPDVHNVTEFAKLLDQTFADNLAKSAVITASNTRGGDNRQFGVANLVDNNRDTYYASDDNVTNPEITIDFGQPKRFNVIKIEEAIALGQRIAELQADQWQSGSWQPLATVTSIGSQRLIRMRPVTTTKIRLRITQCPVAPALAEIGVYSEPATMDAPQISRDAAGMVVITTAAPVEAVRYTLDGSEPTADSAIYQAPFDLGLGGTVRARIFDRRAAGAVASADFDVAHTGWTIASSSFAVGAPNAIDAKPKTIWITRGKAGDAPAPQNLVIDLGQSIELTGFTYLPRQDGSTIGTVDQYTVELSQDGQIWTTAADGEFSNIAANPIKQTVKFSRKQPARYVRFTAKHAVEGNCVSAAELGVLAK